MQITWEKKGRGEVARLWIWYRFEDGRQIKGTFERELVEIGAGDDGQWALAYRAPMLDVQSVSGQAGSLEAAKAAAIAAMPDFVRGLKIRQPTGSKRVPVL